MKNHAGRKGLAALIVPLILSIPLYSEGIIMEIKSKSFKKQPQEIKKIFYNSNVKTKFNAFTYKMFNRNYKSDEIFNWVKTRLDSNLELFLSILNDNKYIQKLVVLESNYRYIKDQLRESDDKHGYIYIIENEAWPGWLKIGKANNLQKRLSNYQTYSPHRDYKLLYGVMVKDYHIKEQLLLDKINESNKIIKNEWIFCKKEYLFNLIKENIKIKDIIHTEDFIA